MVATDKKTLPGTEGIRRGSPARIALVYALFGALWILFSDRALLLMLRDPIAMARVSTYKGWAFIALTAWLLYLLVRADYRKLHDATGRTRESEALLLNVLETLPLGVWIIGADGKIRFGNRAGKAIWSGAEFIGIDRYDLYKAWRVGTGERVEAHEWGAARAIMEGETVLDEELEIECFDGSRKVIRHSAVPLRDAGERVTGAIVVNEDITDRKFIESSLEESEDRLRAIADTASDAVILVDDRKSVVYWNLTAERMFGYIQAEAMGREIDFVVPARYREAHARGFETFAATGEGPLVGKTYEVSAIRKGGAEFPIELSISGIRLKGKWHAAGIVRDISERKSLENQLRHAQKMEALGTLTGGIAHDFNNILTAIIGFATILLMKMDRNDPLIPKVNNILAAADRAANLVKSLLAFSRKEAIELKVVNLPDVVAGVEKLLHQLLQEDVELVIAAEAPSLTVMADAGQIGQLLLNLASNARDALPGGGTVSIRTSPVELDGDFVKHHGYGAPGRYALLSFSDNGVGMDEETRQRIFEPFFTTKGVGKGTGLGLSTSYGIVKQHQGYITCYSEPAQGTTFRVYLPVVGDEAEQPRPSPHPAPAGGAETILLAEDDPLVRGLTGDVLRQFGYTVIEAVDGEEAVARFREQREAIGLVILDLVMPRKNGREAYEEISRLRPGIRAIFTSGYPAEVFRKDELHQKGYDFISKPASPHELLRKVREALDA